VVKIQNRKCVPFLAPTCHSCVGLPKITSAQMSQVEGVYSVIELIPTKKGKIIYLQISISLVDM
jgi:hypothetical protein